MNDNGARVPRITVVRDNDEDDDEVEPEPSTMLSVSIVSDDGIHLNASVHTSPDADPETMAQLLLRAARGAAYLYGEGLLDALDETNPGAAG